MKKAILIIACAMISATTIAQKTVNHNINHADVVNVGPAFKLDSTEKTAKKADLKKAVTQIYKADPNKIYILQLPEQALQALLTTSELGVFPYAKALKVTADKLEDFGNSLSQLRTVVYSQYKRQYLIDSLRSVNPAKFKADSVAFFKSNKTPK